MIYLKGRVAKAENGLCVISVPNDTGYDDMLQVYSEKLVPGQPVMIIIEPMVSKAAGIGRLLPAVS